MSEKAVKERYMSLKAFLTEFDVNIDSLRIVTLS